MSKIKINYLKPLLLAGIMICSFSLYSVIFTKAEAPPDAMILIDGNAALSEFCSVEGTHGDQDGTQAHPYILEGYNLDTNGLMGFYILNVDSYLIIRDCVIINNGAFSYGILIEQCANITIKDNTINIFTVGILLIQSEKVSIISNNCSNNNYGVGLIYSNLNNVMGNNMSYNDIGFYLDNSGENSISENSIQSNAEYGMYLDSSSDNIIWLNHFINNFENQSYDNNINYWNYTTFGNYWSNYELRYPDATRMDSYWNTPYEIDGDSGAFDYFPTLPADTENPVWSAIPTNQTVEFGESFDYIVTATDNVAIGHYWLNDITCFQISPSVGQITNTSSLTLGNYWLTIYVNDTSGNEISTTIKISVVDNENPTWSMNPTDQTVEFGEFFEYAVAATDNVAISYYWLNDTTYFQISSSGGQITNISSLVLGNYWLTIYANDTSGNEISAMIKITVVDTEDPTWVSIPANQTLDEGVKFSYNVSAIDSDTINHYWINDTTHFHIDSDTGLITNATALPVGIYYLSISVDDMSGNDISITIKITVEALDIPTTTTETNTNTEISTTEGAQTGIPGYNLAFFGFSIIFAVILIRKWRITK